LIELAHLGNREVVAERSGVARPAG
jgi:hypothetical protein